MPPSTYDPTSPTEQPTALPSAPLVRLASNVVIQPPLTRRGKGPGVIVFLPPPTTTSSSRVSKPLDPEPVKKWAEEGFAVVGVTTAVGASNDTWSVEDALEKGVKALLALEELDTKDKFGMLVYDPTVASEVATKVTSNPHFACLISYSPVHTTIPCVLHLFTSHQTPSSPPPSSTTRIYKYEAKSPFFVLPNTSSYDPGSAAVSHTRTAAFLRQHLGGPIFDLEAIWEEHCYFEFEVRSVAKTMGTMVDEPYVNHVPTMTGGIGRKNLTAFYRDHFIFANPADTNMQPVSRTVGSDRVVDEFIFKCTHDRMIDWLLPGVPPTGKKLAIPMLGVINIRGDRLYHEHIWWDQGTVMKQAGIIPSHVPFPLESDTDLGGGIGVGRRKMLRLPIAGAEAARLLVDETDGNANEMFGTGWGIQGD